METKRPWWKRVFSIFKKADKVLDKVVDTGLVNVLPPGISTAVKVADKVIDCVQDKKEKNNT
jgi:hypothetical protein